MLTFLGADAANGFNSILFDDPHQIMLLSDFDFALPEKLIAQTPPERRGESRLMVVNRDSGEIWHRAFSEFSEFLENHPLIVLNDTQVIPAKLEGKLQGKDRPREFLLVREDSPGVWLFMTRGLGKLKKGMVIEFDQGTVHGEFMGTREDLGVLRFQAATGEIHALLERAGKMPLPHYIHRSPNKKNWERLDRERYQTVFAREPGAIAAPTAGLHFTENLLDKLQQQADLARVTLHVGPGTFQPVRTEDITRHELKKEFYRISAENWNRIHKAKTSGQNILAVGTTVTRVLETLDFSEPISEEVTGWTNRYLYPGQTFQNTRHLLTNFHLPKSSLFLLVCAFAGTRLMKTAYAEAIRENYRFFSYGDAMLIL